MSAANFVSKLMHSRTQAHVFHLRTKSFAAHKALQAYYEGIVPLLDTWSEAYQGRYGLINGYKIGEPINQNPMNARKYFKKLLTVISNTKMRDTYLLNIRDEIYQLVYQTLYMLSLDQPSRLGLRNRPLTSARKK